MDHRAPSASAHPWRESVPPYAPLRERTGASPIERRAVYRAQLEIQAMPASLVVQIALWPDKLADWAKEMEITPAVVYNMLANVKPYHRVRGLLARRLNVSKEALDWLIEAPRAEPLAKLPPDPQATARFFATPSEGAELSVPTGTMTAPAVPQQRDPPRRRSRRRTVQQPASGQTALNL